MPILGAWDRAVVEFGLAWRLSSVERTVLRMSLGTASQRLDRLVRELLVETAGLALDVGRPELAAWCYEACERVTIDAADRPTWDEVRLARPAIDSLRPALAHGLSPESLVWWCVRLVPTLPDEGPEAACRRVTTYAFYLSVMAMQAFTADDVASRERAGLLAALGGVIARRARAIVAGVPG
jgi:hypothetical protein